MADAGRILIIPRGDYDGNSTYEKLDLVKYKGTSWLARKEMIGIEPSAENVEYWQNMFDLTLADNLTTEGTGYALDARQGKILMDSISETNTNLATESNVRKAEIAVERARINSFTSLAEGSTTGDAELIDARIGANGKVYANAGEAVRGQIKNIRHFVNPKVCIGTDYPNLIVNDLQDMKLVIPKYTGWTWDDLRCEVEEEITLQLIPQASTVLNTIFVNLSDSTTWNNVVTAKDFLVVSHLKIKEVDLEKYRYIGFVKTANSTYGGASVEMGALPFRHNGVLSWEKLEPVLISPPYDGFITLDTKTGILTIPQTSYYTTRHGRYNPPEALSVNVSTFEGSDIWVFFDWDNKELYAVPHTSIQTLDVGRYNYVCSVRYKGEFTMINISIPYLIDGKWFGKIAMDTN